MRIIDLLKAEAIQLNTAVASKEEAIDKMIALHEKAGNLSDTAAYRRLSLQERHKAQPLSVRALQCRTQSPTVLKHPDCRQLPFPEESITAHLTESRPTFAL